MDGSWLLLLLSLLGDLDISVTYNVESSAHRLFSAEDSHEFGYKVVQINSSSGERILIGDPGSNTLHACDVINDKCDNITLPNQQNASHLGLTLEVEPVSSRFLVCGYEEPHDCSKNLYMNGACYTVDSSLVASQMESPGYQEVGTIIGSWAGKSAADIARMEDRYCSNHPECENVAVDLCFLFDDSHSVGDPEFKIVQEFLVSAVKNLKNSTMNFAVVQFASKPQKIFDFKDYQRGEGQRLLDAMTHLGGVTNTFQAINFALNEIFTEEAGEREKAKKIILLVTDGEATDIDKNVIERADERGVARYVIAIGKNYKTELIEKMASSPAQNHSHMMQNYANLKGFFTELQNKILAIEGVGRGHSRVGFTREMSSAGFSAAVTQDQRILGDPGIFDWSGGILDVSKEEQLIYISQKEEDKYGYLGYSIKLLHTTNGLFCVVGSPRFQYVGLVAVLKESPSEPKWKKIGSVLGKQVGCYFGAEIAVSDLDQDGITDLVLISAPHHYEQKWSGEVSVCQFTEMLNCTVTLHGEPGHLHSQFGAAVSSLGDLDGDGYTEVAVGAPYEMDGRGALYIYKGRPAGLSAAYMQRLLSPQGILGFGLSVHGVLDMTEDGLVDVAVGSWGHVTLHRSQPLFNVSVSVTSNQTYMVVSSLEASGCDNGLTLEACVLTEIQTPRYTGSLSMSIQYHLILDSHKPESRMFFTNKQREMNGTLVILGRELQCKNYTIFLQDCGLEDVSEVHVSLTAFVEQVKSPWLLSQSSNLSVANLISFQMCEEGEKCEPDMSIELHHSPLVVQDGSSFSMFLGLHNMHVKAHQTRLSISVPAGLYFRKANFTEASQRISVVCSDIVEQILMCNVSHPYLRRRVKAVIQIMFSIASNMSWADHILLAINVTSDSDGNIISSSAEHEVPILYPIHIISRVENSTKHVPFTKPDTKANATHRYKIQNLGLYTVPINLSVSVSSYEAWIEGVRWDFIISSSQNSHARCFELNDSSALQTHSEKTETMRNKTWQCVLEESGEMSINITGLLKPKTTWKVHSLGRVRSAVMIQYNELRYHSDRKYHTAQVMTQVELLVTPDHMAYIVAGTMVGLILMIVISILLYKCGFFRRYKDRMMEAAASRDPQQQRKGTDTEAAAQLMGPQKTQTSKSLREEPQIIATDQEGGGLYPDPPPQNGTSKGHHQLTPQETLLPCDLTPQEPLLSSDLTPQEPLLSCDLPPPTGAPPIL